MSDVSGGNGSMNNHTHSQRDWDYNNGDVSIRNGLLINHTLSQFHDLNTFKYMECYV